GLGNHSEAAAAQGVVRQPEINDVEQVEKLRPELQDAQLVLPAASERSVLNQAEIKIAIARPAECITTERPESSAVRPRASGNSDRYRKERTVVDPQAEVVLADRAAG